MAKEWKSGLDESPLGDARLWTDSGTTPVYMLRLGWREYHFTRGEILLSLFVGLFAGLIFAAAQAGYLKLPERRALLVEYQAPEPRLLGSTESTRPEAGDPDMHFIDARGRPVSRPVSHAEKPTPVPASEAAPAAPATEARPEPESAVADPEPVV